MGVTMLKYSSFECAVQSCEAQSHCYRTHKLFFLCRDGTVHLFDDHFLQALFSTVPGDFLSYECRAG